MAVILILILISIFFVLLFRLKKKKELSYKCFLLTLPKSEDRQRVFFKYHDPTDEIETIYGIDTKRISNAEKFKHIIKPEYYKEAIRLKYDRRGGRPDITYFNLGAIGCYMGHMEFYRRCFEQNLKYALVFEDNVIVKDHQLYDQIQSVIDVMGDDFEMCFFHCLSRYPDKRENGLERVKWISSTKCYLIHVENMKQYYKYFFPIDNHVDMKHEDIIAEGARVYYKDMRKYMRIDRGKGSTIGHSDWGKKNYFSRQYPNVKTDVLIRGY